MKPQTVVRGTRIGLFALLALLLLVNPSLAVVPGPTTYKLVFGGGYAAASGIDAVTDVELWGDGSWRETYPSGKTDIYIGPVAQLGGTFTVDQIAGISYQTRNGANNPSDVDFYVAVYTALGSGTNCTGSWYCHRLNAEPYLSNNYAPPVADVWNLWTTDAGPNQLTFFDQPTCGAFGFYGEPTLQDIQAGPIAWSTYPACSPSAPAIDYGGEPVLYLSFQTGSGWAAFDGYLDAITVELTSGAVYEIDLEDFVSEVWVDDVWAGSGFGVEVETGKFFGHNAFATIQDAVANVVGSTVHVGPGAYSGNVVISTVGLELLADPGAVLTGGVHITANNVTVDGLTILGGGTFAGTVAGILVDGSTSGHLLSDNTITGTGTAGSRGVEFGYYTSSIEVTGNEISAWPSGIYINPTNLGSNLNLHHNYLHDNFAGIGSDGLNDVLVTNNIFEDNTEGWGASTVGAGVQGYHNIFSSNTTGIAHYSGSAIAATCNWWDDISGPTSTENIGGLGDSFSSSTAGLVTFSPWLVYNTDASTDIGFQIPTAFTVAAGADTSAADNGYRRLENAIGCVLDGQTVTISGTFDWTAANAAASWALGNDGVASTVDDYSILAPAGVNNVTLTAASLGSATIQGPGDLAAANLEGVLIFDGGDNQNWTISNLRFVDFDLGIGMFYGAGGTDAFNGTTITNNYFLVASDLNSAAAPADVNQNIGIHYAFGLNQTISGNTIEFPGDGLSDAGAPADWWTFGVAGGSLFSSNIGMQSNTSGGAVYDGLLIDNNTLTVLNAQSANPARIFGIWENGHAHGSDITVSSNAFTNLAAGNDPTLNRQMAFRVTSHSSASTTVAYTGNTVTGASIGFSGIDVGAGVSPIEMTGNIVSSANTGFLLKGLHNWHLSDTDLSNSGTMAGVGTGVQVPANAVVTLDAAVGSNTLSGFATGVKSAGTVVIEDNTTSIVAGSVGVSVTGGTATIDNNTITGNDTGIDVSGGTATIENNTIGSNNTGVLIHTTGSATLSCNDIAGNTNFGVNNTTAAVVDAELNWWGSASGPAHASNPTGTGDVVSDNVDFVPWATAAMPGGCTAAAAETVTTGRFYVAATGAVIPGGSISVSGSGATVVLDGSAAGEYEFVTDGTGSPYTLSATPPTGYVLDTACPAQAGPLDPTGGPNPLVLGSGLGAPSTLADSTCAANPYYLSFDLAAGDPFVYNNNLPLQGTATLGDRVWNDLNNNGIQDSGEPGLANVDLKLFTATGTVPIATTTTDPSGSYSFSNLYAGTFRVQIEQAEFFPTGTLHGFIATQTGFESVTNPVTFDATVVVLAGEAVTTVDFGLIGSGKSTIGDYVWRDLNGNGLHTEINEVEFVSGIGGVTLSLYRDDGDGIFEPDPTGATGDLLYATTTTAANGQYDFDVAAFGKSYWVAVDASNFAGAGALVGLTTTNTGAPNPDRVLVSMQNGPVDSRTDADLGYSAPANYLLTKTLDSVPPLRSGETATFTIEISNTGGMPLTVVPLVDTYDINFLSFVSSTPPPIDSTNDGTLNWSNALTSPPLLPGESATVVLTFQAGFDTSLLIPPWTVNTAATSGVIADPGLALPPDPVPLPPQTAEAPVEILSPTAVNLASFTAERVGGGVQLAWETVAETDFIGFAVTRIAAGGARTRLNAELIPAERAGQSGGARYTYLDEAAGDAAFYLLHAYTVDGGVHAVGILELNSAQRVFLPLLVR